MKQWIGMVWAALFLEEMPYADMRERADAVLRGLGLVVLVGVIVAVLGLVGTTLEWATSPKPDAVHQVVWRGLQKMSWYKEMQGSPGFAEEFPKQFDMIWQAVSTFAFPNVGSAALQIILSPLGLVIGWAVYGLLGHLFARMLGGQGTLSQTFGCTALAVAPQLLNLLSLVPYLEVGGVVGTWVLLCRYMALKTCHQLSWGRAVAATLLPYILRVLAILVLIGLGAVIVPAVIGAMSS
ncbi:MAG: YIP1 family protein [Anaerolineae bacterium]|nr:YIP1 family protein [Anaerolineae bacterium]